MRQRRHAALVVFLVAVFIIIAGLAGTSNAQAREAHAGAAATKEELELKLSMLRNNASDEPVAPELDTCLHCHLSGSIESLWTPIWRWVIFGMAGIVFVFGAYQAGSTYVSRRKWVPLSTRTIEWLDDRFQIVEPIKKILDKPVSIFSTRWMYCLGGIAFTLFLIQGLTGIMLAFFYQPTPEAAYESILYIENEVNFGASIRSIHHWAANGMIVLVVAHMIRVFIHGAFKPPRELNWVSGVLLFILTLGFGFTGYLLPWDQRAYWATTVGTEIAGAVPQIGEVLLVFLRGGWDVTGVTLSRFYALHIIVLPLTIVLLLGLHFWMVRRQGISRPL